MSVNAEHLVAFAARAHRSLIQCKIIRQSVLLHRLRKLNHITCYSTGIQRTSAPTVHIFPVESASNSIAEARLPVASTAHETRTTQQTSPLLPITCPGCGALSQAVNVKEAGYYTLTRKAVRGYLRRRLNPSRRVGNDRESGRRSEQQNNDAPETESVDNVLQPLEVPLCDRCHDLVYDNKGTSIAHPTTEALADSIAESPFKHNHVYHVLDAVDFPMSLIPKIFRTLDLAKPRSQNRRARAKFTSKPTVSFIITRSDLLGRSKEIVDKMMPYFQSILRSALGRIGRDMRLGNVHLVSAKRGWWTKELKDSIWERGGGNWMIGKVNVGKSSLFPVLFPKGSGERAPVYADLEQQHEDEDGQNSKLSKDDAHLPEDSLLPPPQSEVRFPVMPIVSHLPGTTASPIRLPFGSHKGELVDLPGLERGDLEEYVQPDHRLDLVMRYRPNVTQHVIKAGQSLLLGGGLIRITPHLDMKDRSTTMLAYPFVPIDAHVTSTEKAIGAQLQQRESGIKSILAEEAGSSIASGGIYALTTDVTKLRAGAIVRAGVPLTRLPFRIYSADILIEGVGWVELVCQVRRRTQSTRNDFNVAADSAEWESKTTQAVHGNGKMSGLKDLNNLHEMKTDFKPFSEQTLQDADIPGLLQSDLMFPKVEVFSPNGKHVGLRKPLGAWMLWEEGTNARLKTAVAGRPRKSMKGTKKRAKVEQRTRVATFRVI